MADLPGTSLWINKRRKDKLLTPEAKRRKAQRNFAFNRQRINIGGELGRWNVLKAALGYSTHVELAAYLLDLHYTRIQSTPSGSAHPHFVASDTDPPSDIPMSGVEALGEGSEEIAEEQEIIPSHLPEIDDIENQDNLSITIVYPDDETLAEAGGEEAEREDDEFDDDVMEPDPDDKSWHPSFSLEHKDDEHIRNLPVWSDGELLDIVEQTPEPTPQGDFGRVSSAEELDNQQLFITYEWSLKELLRRLLPPCHCAKPFDVKFQGSGTGMYVQWSCEDGHLGGRWCSQPKLNRGMLAGDLLWSTSLLFSGNSFEKVRLMFHFMNCGKVNASTFYGIQREYAIPVIEDSFKALQEEILTPLHGEKVIMAGDGRMDSPGFSAEYCTYLSLNHETSDILHVAVVNKREVDNKSPTMEKEGLIRSLKFLRERGVEVAEVITDAHIGIASHFKKNEPNIKHSWDVWHGAKNLGKKIVAAGQTKDTRQLVLWSRDICNHFWDCAKTCDRSHAKFLSKWRGVVHHVQNVHSWMFGDGAGPGECEHEPLDEQEERNKPWLLPRSKAFRALKAVLTNPRLLDNIVYYVNYRHTGVIESINAHILMYCPKRQSYRPPAFRARTLLALMDYQHHKNLPAKTNEDGTVMYRRRWSKGSKAWTAVPMKVDKQYKYVPAMQKKVLQRRLLADKPLRSKVTLKEGDPRLISPTLAPVAPPSTSQVVASQMSRFAK